MKQFKQCSPRRRSLQFSLLRQEHPDEFYELHYSNIYVEVYTLVEKTFSPKNSHKGPARSLWLREYPEQFKKYVELLARPDPFSGKWDRLLRDENERSFLLQAIIMKTLDTQVFSSLLFGADPEHMKILQAADASFVNAEGFQRSDLRASTNNMYLDSKGGMPPLFWDEVDKLATQTLVMLLPAYMYTSQSICWEPPLVEELHQWLHDVIAYAAWLNICTRLSSAIIVTQWLSPGERFQMTQENLSQDLYEISRKKTQQHDRRLGVKEPKGIFDGWIARVKISVTPEMIRYTPAEDDMGMEGMTTYTIMKPHVVYYQGRYDDQEEERGFISLPTYLESLRRRKGNPYFAALVVMLLAVVAMLWLLYTAPGQRTWEKFEKFQVHWNSTPTPEPVHRVEPDAVTAEPEPQVGTFVGGNS
ncbi:hypothetical protein G7046_g9219 [Stylonectria norvegica]|nr:hypothetical protein G7046_g9219 [Stylonectria norvegica]